MFASRLSFTQEENKEDFAELIKESKQKMKSKQAQITAIDLQNVEVQPLTLFKSILSKSTKMVELVLHDSQVLP